MLYAISDEYSVYMSRLGDNIKKCGLSISRNVPGDGNCFFACISDQLDILGDHTISQQELREQVAAYLRTLVINICCCSKIRNINYRAIHKYYLSYWNMGGTSGNGPGQLPPLPALSSPQLPQGSYMLKTSALLVFRGRCQGVPIHVGLLAAILM